LGSLKTEFFYYQAISGFNELTNIVKLGFSEF